MKMLKEEKELRKWAAVIEYPEENSRDFYKDIRNLIRAVREDCAEAAWKISVDNYLPVRRRTEYTAAIRKGAKSGRQVEDRVV